MAKAKKLPSGSWRVQATANGITKSFTGTDKREVEFRAMEWQQGHSTNAVEDITLAEAYKRYIDAKKQVLSPSTIRSYRRMSKNHLQELMNKNINSLTEEQVQISINTISASHSPKTVRNINGLLSAVLCMFRPSFKPNIKLPQKIKTELYIPSKEEVKAVLEAAKDTNFYLAILLASTCGMRAGEICALTYEDVSDNKIRINKSLVRNNNGEWLVKPPKTFSGNRYVEIPPNVKTLLTGKNGRIFTYNPSTLSKEFNKLLKRNNLPMFRFHDLRHFFISECFDMQLPEKYIISIVGHSSSNITKAVYDHISAKKQSQYAVDIASHFADFN